MNNPRKKKILLSRPNQISPLKEVPQSVSSFPLPQSSRSAPPPLPKLDVTLSKQQIHNIASGTDSLKSVELMKIIVQQESEQLQKSFLRNTDPIFAEAFHRTLEVYHQNLTDIKQERIANLNEEQIIFVPPDQDKFQTRKGKILNDCVKTHLKINQEKAKLEESTAKLQPFFEEVNQFIKSESGTVQRGEIEEGLYSIMEEVKVENRERVDEKYTELRQQLSQMLQMSRKMMNKKKKHMLLESHEQIWGEHVSLNKIEQEYKYSTLLYSVEDYFL